MSPRGGGYVVADAPRGGRERRRGVRGPCDAGGMDDEHRDRARLQHVVADAAEQQRARLPEPARADEDQVVVAGDGPIDDRCARRRAGARRDRPACDGRRRAPAGPTSGRRSSRRARRHWHSRARRPRQGRGAREPSRRSRRGCAGTSARWRFHGCSPTTTRSMASMLPPRRPDGDGVAHPSARGRRSRVRRAADAARTPLSRRRAASRMDALSDTTSPEWRPRWP